MARLQESFVVEIWIVTVMIDWGRYIPVYCHLMTQERALEILKTGANVFLTGEPGSGKTHIVNQYVSYLHDHDIEPAITASTGIAATHVGGMTIHSWSGIGIRKVLTPYELDALASKEPLVKRLAYAKVLIIDEISMLDGVTLSTIDTILRTLRQNGDSFGGLQVVFVGDFFQLPPIADKGSVAQFAFEAQAWRNAKPLVCYLSEQHRQEDLQFLNTLNAIRSGDAGEEVFEHLKTRFVEASSDLKDMTRLYTHNVDVDKMNKEALARLEDEEHIFLMETMGNAKLIEGMQKHCLSPAELVLKLGAKVMFTKNNFEGGYVNGTLGEVIDFETETGRPMVRTRNGRVITTSPIEWTVEDNGKMLAKLIQIPLRLAWAITVHKSQGMSLDEAVMDLSRAFEYGQGYVALSRVRSLDGLHLLGFNSHALAVHPNVSNVDTQFRQEADAADEQFDSMETGEITDMHERFILAMGGSLEVKTRKGKEDLAPKLPTHEITRSLLTDSATLEDIAEERGMTVGTIISHLEKLIELKLINREEHLAHLKPEQERLNVILNAFQRVFEEEEVRSLSPVKRILGDEYSFDELKFARMFIDAT